MIEKDVFTVLKEQEARSVSKRLGELSTLVKSESERELYLQEVYRLLL